MMPKMKKTKKQRRRTFPSMGNVSKSKFTNIRMPERRTRARESGIDHHKGAMVEGGKRKEGKQGKYGSKTRRSRERKITI